MNQVTRDQLNNLKKHYLKKTPLNKASRLLRNPGDEGYDKARFKKCTDKHELTGWMVIERFDAFAQEFRQFSSREMNERVNSVAHKYDKGIGPVCYQFRATDRNREPDKALLQFLNMLVEGEKEIGDMMIKILSFGVFWSRSIGKDIFTEVLNRCAVRAVLHLFMEQIFVNTPTVTIQFPQPPPIQLDMICKFWKVSERYNRREVEILAKMAPRGAPLNLPWGLPVYISNFIEDRRRKLLPLKIAKHRNMRELKGEKTIVESVWAQDPKSWNQRSWYFDPRNPFNGRTFVGVGRSGNTTSD